MYSYSILGLRPNENLKTWKERMIRCTKEYQMSTPRFETHEQRLLRRIGSAAAYSALIQEGMRDDTLCSSDYPLVMTILRAVDQGSTEERWQEEHQRPLKALANRPPHKGTAHADAANRYEQMVCCLKDLSLWPWEGDAVQSGKDFYENE